MSNSIALLGQPNSGKSTVFNALTGSRQHVGNWPGKTVEKNDGVFTWKDKKYNVTDLPGSYGLSGNSDEEKITVDFIKRGQADLVLILVDASQLERSMFMVAEFAALKAPAVLLLNMMDIAAQQKKEIDAKKLSEKLGIPVLPFTAADSKNYDTLKELISENLKNPKYLVTKPDLGSTENILNNKAVNTESEAKYKWIEEQLEGVTKKNSSEYKLSKFDLALTSKVKGKIITIGIVLLAFMAAMLVMMPFMAIGSAIPGAIGKPITKGLESMKVHPRLVSIFGLLLPNVLYFSISMSGFVFGVNF